MESATVEADVEEATEICSQCNNRAEQHDTDGQPYCQDCYDDAYTACYHCDSETVTDDARQGTHSNQLYCDDCWCELFATCNSCADTIRQNDAYVVDGDTYCQTCYEDNYFCCEGCNEECGNGEYGENGYCQSCIDARHDEEDRRQIHDYSYKPEPDFFGKDGPYFGVELEVEADNIQVSADLVEDALGDHVYLKHDGSLSHGFEIVSHPHNWHAWKEQTKTLEDLFSALKKAKTKSWDTTTCGMHVHVSKGSLSTLAIYKLLTYVYDNQDFLYHLSGRKREQLAQWATLDGTHAGAMAKAKNGNNRRYEAVNLQNAKTVEFRIFRGTLNPRRFWRNLECVHALYHFIQTEALDKMTETHFRAYVTAHSKTYRQLHAYLTTTDKQDLAPCVS